MQTLGNTNWNTSSPGQASLFHSEFDCCFAGCININELFGWGSAPSVSLSLSLFDRYYDGYALTMPGHSIERRTQDAGQCSVFPKTWPKLLWSRSQEDRIEMETETSTPDNPGRVRKARRTRRHLTSKDSKDKINLRQVTLVKWGNVNLYIIYLCYIYIAIVRRDNKY